jgi:hypothetical protein
MGLRCNGHFARKVKRSTRIGSRKGEISMYSLKRISMSSLLFVGAMCITHEVLSQAATQPATPAANPPLQPAKTRKLPELDCAYWKDDGSGNGIAVLVIHYANDMMAGSRFTDCAQTQPPPVAINWGHAKGHGGPWTAWTSEDSDAFAKWIEKQVAVTIETAINKEALKQPISEEIQKKAADMAEQRLAARLAELDARIKSLEQRPQAAPAAPPKRSVPGPAANKQTSQQ